MSPRTALLLADVLLAIHAAFIAFVVLGLAAVLVGGWRGWAWVRSRWFRFSHLAAILYVVGQTWLGHLCPLTIWEDALRRRAGQPGYDGSFIAHWVGSVIYYDAPWWIFVLAYTLFAAAVVAAWFAIPPRRR